MASPLGYWSRWYVCWIAGKPHLLLRFLTLFILLFFRIILGQSGVDIDVCVMEAGMAPMITAAIVCSAYGLKPRLSNMIVSIGIPLSFLTLAIWYYIITYIL